MSIGFDIPVAFCFFNREDKAMAVFSKIKEVRPQKLYLISDGPRDCRDGEDKIVNEVRDAVLGAIDWECEVKTNFAEKNMGCGDRISSGLSWVFDNEEQAIILEDDCVPDVTFFEYCRQMLDYYKDDERIMSIGGSSSDLYDAKEGDYCFTKTPFIWGWATWRRAWNKYDYKLKDWPELKKSKFFKKHFPGKSYLFYTSEFQALYNHKFDTWDYQLMYATIKNNMLNISPKRSYISNIGFDGESTHTATSEGFAVSSAFECEFPIRHRKNVEWDEAVDLKHFERVSGPAYVMKVKEILGLDVNKSVFK